MTKHTDISKNSSGGKIKSKIFAIALVFISFLPLFAANTEKDELKENLLGSEKKQKLALLS
jgi:hypothetical protein